MVNDLMNGGRAVKEAKNAGDQDAEAPPTGSSTRRPTSTGTR
ncbi:hypothetical protein [Bradyrhizobium sp.]